MPVAFNKQTGELRVLDQSGQWVAPKTAENPQTGERLYLEGNEWKPVPLSENEEGAGFAASVLQGPTMGFGDELVATLENPVEAIQSTITGGPSPGYDASLKKFRGIESRYRAANPVKSFVATAGGGLAGGGIQLGRAAFQGAARLLPNAGRVGQAMTTGAGFGGVAGFGSGEGGLADRLMSATYGAGTGAAVGAGFEIAAPAIGAIIQRVRGNPRLWDRTAGRLTREGEQAAREAGLDPAQASQALQREFATQAQNALNPAEAAAQAEASSLPVPIRLRTGQVTLDPAQQLDESQMAKGVYGQLAGERIRGSEQAQQEALRANVREIANRIGGGQVQELGQGASAVQGRLSRAANVVRARVNQLYDMARNTDGDAFILGRNVSEAILGIRQNLERQGFIAENATRVHSLLNRAAGALADTTEAVGREPNISVANLFSIRQALSALSRSSDSVEATAAGNATRQLSRWIDQALDEDLIRGNPATVELWRRAIAARRELARRFQGGDFIEKLVERSDGGRGAELKLDPQSAMNLIFGRSDTGFTTQGGMLRSLVRLRNELGEGSPQWNALREEAFLRLARSGEGATTPTGRDFSGANFAKAWEDALAKSPGVMRALFSDQERNLISQFARVARRTTTNVRGGNNTSNTGAAVAQSVRKLFMSSFMGPRLAAFLDSLPVVRGLQDIGQDLRAVRATQGRVAQGTRPQPTPRLNQAVEIGTGSSASALVQSVFGDP